MKPAAPATTAISERPRVIIESPYASDIPRNTEYLRRCLRDSWQRGELPFASHAFYPFFLSEETERDAGLFAGYTHWQYAKQIIFYMDYGMSSGMKLALQRAMSINNVSLSYTDFRMIGQNPTPKLADGEVVQMDRDPRDLIINWGPIEEIS